MENKKSILLLFSLCLFSIGYTQVIRTVNNTAGNLKTVFTADENKTIKSLKISGTLNAEDLFFVRDNLSVIQNLDLSEARIISPLDTIPNSAFRGKMSLKQVSFPMNLTCIGNAAFIDCTGLLSVEIPESVSSIGPFAFSACGLKSVVLHRLDISNYVVAFSECDSLALATTSCVVSSGGNVFSGCNNLKTIIVPEGVTSIRGSAFYQLSSLRNIILPSTLTSIGSQSFYNCTNLDSIVIPEGVTSIGEGAFWECNKMRSVKLPNSIITIKSTGFAHCRSLTSVSIPLTATNIEAGAFRSCSGLTTVTTSYGNASVSGNAFETCQNIRKVIIPQGTTAIKNYAFSNFGTVSTFQIPTSVKTIGDNAFLGCIGTDSITIPDSVTTIGASAFSGCNGLRSMTIPKLVTKLGTYSFRNCTNLISIRLADGLSSIDDGVFSGCSKLNSVILPSALVSIGRSAFYACAALDLFVIPNTVTSLGESCFSGCLSLKSIIFPASISSINNTTFSGCTSLSQVQFPTTLTSIGVQSFLNCNGLTSITIPTTTTVSNDAFKNCKGLLQATTAYAYNNGSIFNGCDNLKTINIPTGVSAIRDYAFYNFAKIDSIQIPITVRTIGRYAFAGCTSLSKFHLPADLTTIGDYAMSNCSSLTSINFPITLSTIPSYCFSKCSAISSVTIPQSVKTINSNAFEGCVGLSTIFTDNSFPLDLIKSTTVFNNVSKTTCVLNVPYGTKSRYASAYQWGDFSNILEQSAGIYISTNKAELLSKPESTTTIDVNANVAWTASSNQPWLTVSPNFGTGSNALTLIADNSEISVRRNAQVTLSALGVSSQVIEVVQKTAPKSVNIESGGLFNSLTPQELSNLSELSISGTIDARDFKTMRDEMPELTDLDLTEVSIVNYAGSDGTYPSYSNYAANELPQNSFNNILTNVGKITLKSVKLPATLAGIANSSFAGCTELTTISLPTSINYLGSSVFYNCTRLSSIVANSSFPIDLINSTNVFYNVNKTACVLYVPYGSKALYSLASQWSSFTSVVENSRGLMPSVNMVNLHYSHGSYENVDIKSNVTWTVKSDQPWLTVNPNAGSDNNTLTLTAEANLTTMIRTAKVTLMSPDCASQIINVAQYIAPKNVVLVAGQLSTSLTAEELVSTSALTITGTIDARDFKTIRDKMPSLIDLDLAGASIQAYTGTEGTYLTSTSINYLANSIPQYAFYNGYSAKKTFKSILLPTGLNSIGGSAFQSCTGLTSIKIPSSVSLIESYAFNNCSSLTSIYSNSSYPIDLSKSGNVFTNVNKTTCTLIVPYKSKSLYSNSNQWSAFTNITEQSQGIFPGVNSLKIEYAAGNTYSVNIQSNVDWTVTSDQSWLTLSKGTGSNIGNLSIEAASNETTEWRYATVTVSAVGFDSQIIKVTQTGVPKTIEITGGGLFSGLSSTEMSTISDLIITGTIDARDFKTMRDNMPELARLDLSGATIVSYTGTAGTLSNNTTYTSNSVPGNAFYNSTSNVGKASLSDIKLPKNVKSFGYSAFKACTGLVSFKIPATTIALNYSTFQGCSNLTSIYVDIIYPLDLTSLGWIFDGVNKSNCTLYVPYGSKPLYSVANTWKDFSKIAESKEGFFISQRLLNFPAAIISKTDSIAVKTNVNWVAQSNQDWLKVNPNTTPNDTVLRLTAAPNTTNTIRSASVVVSSDGYTSQTITVIQAAAPRKINAGGLSTALTALELNTIADLALIGTIDARDFKTMRDNMSKLTNLDLSNVEIMAYEGLAGPSRSNANVRYLANEIPQEAFDYANQIKSIILPQSITTIGSMAFTSAMNLASVTWFPRIKYIRDKAFQNCPILMIATQPDSLNSVCLPDSLISIGADAFSLCANLSGTLRIPSSLKTIQSGAFYNCGRLTGDLIIPSSVQSIGQNGFYSCGKLTSIVINSANTSIGDYAFSRCWEVTTVALPDGITKINKFVFSSCSQLKSIHLPSTLKFIDEAAFAGTGLTEIIFPEALTSIGVSAFSGTSPTSLVVPTTLKNIGDGAFSGCTKLSSIQFPTTFKLISNYLFDGCTSLNSVSFPASLDSIGNSAFAKCSSMTEVILPPNISSVGNGAFQSCTGLKFVHFPQSLKTIEAYTFSGCTGLDSINIPSSVIAIRNHAFENCTGLLKVILPAQLTTLEDGLFYNCKRLNDIVLPSTLILIGNNAFSGCTGLTKFDFPESLLSIGGYAFENCIGLTSLVFPTSLLSINGRAFQYCTSLKSVQLSQNIKGLGDETFNGCSGLTSIDLPQQLNMIGTGCFMGCSALSSIIIPPNITKINSNVFANCINLSSVTLNSGIICLDSYAFSACPFKTIVLPNTLNIIEYDAFAYCNNLTSIAIPSNVTKIAEHAFMLCTNLTSINIPASVSELGVGAFSGCTSLSTVYAYPLTPVNMSFNGDGFWGVNKATCSLYVPMGKKTAYLNANYWKDFTNIIEMPTAVPTLIDDNLVVYPNPIKEYFRIQGIEGTATVLLIDISGKMLLQQQVQANQDISIRNIPNGLYFVRIYTKDGKIEKRVIK